MKKKFIKTPLKGVYVHGAKDVGTRTVNLLMGEHAGEYVRGDIMDANAVIQAFDELKGNVDSEHDSLEEVVDELHNLRDATDQSFEVFLEKAEEETANRIQGDKTLDEKIDQKERESKERDNVLQLNIDTEKQERVNADTQLRNDLTAEVNRAKARENALDSDIQAEATKRENDDNTIKDNLNAEVTRATAKENEIKAEVDVINGDSTTEGSFRKAIADVVGAAPEAYDTLKEIADKLNENDDLHAAINDAIATKATTVALNEEIARAKAAEAENKAEITAETARAKKVEGDNAFAIQNETSRATNAEEAINEAVNTEVERAKGQEAYLQNIINTKADTTALEGAKTELDEKINNLKFIPYNNVYDSSSILHYQLADKKGIDLSSYLQTAKLSGNEIRIEGDNESLRLFKNAIWLDSDGHFNLNVNSRTPYINFYLDSCRISAKIYGNENKPVIEIKNAGDVKDNILELGVNGITLSNGDDNHVLTSNAGIIDITEYAKKTELDNKFASKVDTTTFNEQVDTLNAAISAKLDAGNYIPYDPSVTGSYLTDKHLAVKFDDANTSVFGPGAGIMLKSGDNNSVNIGYPGISLKNGDCSFIVNPGQISQVAGGYKFNVNPVDGIKWSTPDGSVFSQINQNGLYAKASDHEYALCNSKNFLDIKRDDSLVILTPELLLILKNGSNLMDVNPSSTTFVTKIGDTDYSKLSLYNYGGDAYMKFSRLSDNSYTNITSGSVYFNNGFGLLSSGIYSNIETVNPNCIYDFRDGTFYGKFVTMDTSLGHSVNLIDSINEVKQNISSKQDKITPTAELDLTSIDTADIESLRSIVKSLATELNTLGLIKLKSAEETA